MPCIATSIITNELNTDPMVKPIAQRKRSMGEEMKDHLV